MVACKTLMYFYLHSILDTEALIGFPLLWTIFLKVVLFFFFSFSYVDTQIQEMYNIRSWEMGHLGRQTHESTLMYGKLSELSV